MPSCHTRLRSAGALVAAVCVALGGSTVALAHEDDRRRGVDRVPPAHVPTAPEVTPVEAPSMQSAVSPELTSEFAGRWRLTSSASGVEYSSSEAGSTWTLRFRGVGVELFGTLASDHGQATVRIDDGPETTVDQYAPEQTTGTAFFVSPRLAYGDHVVVLTVQGKRGKDSDGRQVAITHASVDSGTSTLTVDDGTTGTALGAFDYRGQWSSRQDEEGEHEGGVHSSGRTGSSFSFRFRGVGLELHGSAAPEHGQATVSIDGGAPVLVDQYAADPADGVEFFESPPLADGEHVATLTVLNQRQDAAVDDLVTIDKAVVTQVLAADGPAGGTLSEPDLEGAEPDDARGTASDGARGSVLDDGRGAVLRESGDGAATSLYATTSTNDVHPLWHVEPGSEPVARTRGSITKVGGDRFHRMFSKQRFGGPGKTLTIAYRARATEIRDRSGSSIVEGAKIGLKWPVDRSLTGYDEDDPRSVHGTSSQGDRSSPGSYAFLTGLTEEGYLELARNGYGSDEYTFFPNESVGYTPGTWKDIVVKVDWQVDRSIRVRFWHNAHATGKPVYDVTDERSPFWSEPGFLWLRTDDTDFEYDSITVRECEVGC